MRFSCAYLYLFITAALFGGDAPTVFRTADGGQFVNHHGLQVLSVSGDATALGTQAGQLIATPTQAIVTAMSQHPALVAGARQKDIHLLATKISPAYRQELQAIAKHAHINEQALINLNLSVDVLCTAVVRLPHDNQPLRIARNMDFAPAGLLGPMTTIYIRRSPGLHATCSIGWPGYVGIVSGINDVGVTACLLLNHGGTQASDGESLGLRLRSLLESADTCEQALALFSATPVSSANYVLLADAKQAVIVWHDKDGFHRSDPSNGWLLCTNAAIGSDGIPVDARGRHVFNLINAVAHPNLQWMQRILTASYMPKINAQAMIFEPSTLSLVVAMASTLTPAAHAPWHHLQLTSLLQGIRLEDMTVRTSPAIADRLPHYSE